MLSRETFQNEVAELDRRIGSLNYDGAYVGMQRIVKSIGDGHTGINAPEDRAVLPIGVARFGDDFRIVSIRPGYENALGARITAVGGVPIADTWTRVMSLTPQGERDELRHALALILLTRGYILHGLDVVPERSHAAFSLVGDDGHMFVLDLQALRPDENVNLVSISGASALRFHERNSSFACSDLTEPKAVYCAWRGYDNLYKYARQMFAMIDKSGAKKLILDLRDNGGGDYTDGDREILEPIKARADLNQKSRLYVLIGADTFSAAMNNAAQFQDDTNAILAGETIGEKPNSYQEPRQFSLPNSRLVVRYSTLFYTFRKKGENVVRPDKEIIPSWNDVQAGRDPVLNWALAQPIN